MALLTPARLADMAARFLDRQEPGLIKATRAVWRDMDKATPESAIRAMLQAGQVPDSIGDVWAELYANFVLDKVVPRLAKTAAEAASKVSLSLTMDRDAVQALVDARGASMITNLTDTQRRAVSAILRHHTAVEPLTQRQLSSVLRPALGLTESGAARMLRLRQRLKDDGVPSDRIEKIVTRTANSAKRSRADTIARTELATAYNSGTQAAIEKGVAEGAFDGPVLKEWRTQRDEITCPICAPLNKLQVGLNESFPTGDLPPAHPRCRCVVLYRTDDV